jgi:membrane associated rhomboid family serine protease
MHTRVLCRSNAEACPHVAGRLIALGIALASLAIQSVATWSEALQWQRGGESVVTWLTCHLCHWSWDHLIWDLFAFMLLSFLALRFHPTRYLLCLMMAGLLIPLEVQLNQGALVLYRGLSGIDCALLGLVVAALWRFGPSENRLSKARWLALLVLGGFAVKTGYELLTGGTVFVASESRNFVPAPSAHLVGFGTGLVLGLVKGCSKREVGASWPSGAELGRKW